MKISIRKTTRDPALGGYAQSGNLPSAFRFSPGTEEALCAGEGPGEMDGGAIGMDGEGGRVGSVCPQV